MFKVHLVNATRCRITLKNQLITIRDTNIQTSLQIFVKLMHYFSKFSNFFINNCKFDIKFKLGLPIKNHNPSSPKNWYNRWFRSFFDQTNILFELIFLKLSRSLNYGLPPNFIQQYLQIALRTFYGYAHAESIVIQPIAEKQ